MSSTTSMWRVRSGDEYRTLDGGFADRHRRKEGAGTAKGDTVPEETTDAMQVKARGGHGFGGVTDVVINVQGVEACQLTKRDVVDQVASFHGHVERARPSRRAKQATELVLIVRLGHEHLRTAKAAAHHA